MLALCLRVVASQTYFCSYLPWPESVLSGLFDFQRLLLAGRGSVILYLSTAAVRSSPGHDQLSSRHFLLCGTNEGGGT
jgi:hypothetical protein